MKNYLGPGESVTRTVPSGGVVSGSGYKIGNLFCVATVTAAAGERAVFQTAGIVTLPKFPTENWAEGTLVWFQTSSGLSTSVSTTGLLIGSADGATVNPSVLGNVRLNGVALTAS